MMVSVNSPNVMFLVRICVGCVLGAVGTPLPALPTPLRAVGSCGLPAPTEPPAEPVVFEEDEATVGPRSFSKSIFITFGEEDDLLLLSTACSDEIAELAGCLGGPISERLN